MNAIIPAPADITAETILPAFDSAWPLGTRMAWFRANSRIEWLRRPQAYRDEILNAPVEEMLALAPLS